VVLAYQSGVIDADTPAEPGARYGAMTSSAAIADSSAGARSSAEGWS
jgi:hypothetical protein